MADIARTYTRRTVRFLTNDQRMAQNVGDYTYLALSVLGGKGLKALGVAPTLASRASQLNKAGLINKAVQKPTTASNGNTPVRTFSEQKQMLEGLDLAGGKIHKNSLQYVGETHVYVIKDSSGKILKYGESAAGVNKYGQSKRAQAQVRQLEKANPGKEFESEIVRNYASKKEARLGLQGETRYIDTHRKIFGKDSLQLNKNRR